MESSSAPHTGRAIQVGMWGTLPYISKQGLQILLNDLPSKDAPGRDGQPAGSVVCSARVALNLVPTKVVRDSLDHLSSTLANHTVEEHGLEVSEPPRGLLRRR